MDNVNNLCASAIKRGAINQLLSINIFSQKQNMRPKKLLKYSSPSFGRSGSWVMTVILLVLLFLLRHSVSGEHRMVGVPAKALRRSSQ